MTLHIRSHTRAVLMDPLGGGRSYHGDSGQCRRTAAGHRD